MSSTPTVVQMIPERGKTSPFGLSVCMPDYPSKQVVKRPGVGGNVSGAGLSTRDDGEMALSAWRPHLCGACSIDRDGPALILASTTGSNRLYPGPRSS